jgi:hypothetical protein
MTHHVFSEFPEYDDTLIMPNGWTDISWHNNACPSISKTIKSDVSLVIWCDYKAPERRLDGQGSTQDATRFYLSLEEKDDIGELHLVPVNEFFTLDSAVIFADSLANSLLQGA